VKAQVKYVTCLVIDGDSYIIGGRQRDYEYTYTLRKVKEKCRVIPVLNYVIKYCGRKIYGGWRYSSTVPNLDTEWRRVIRFTPCHCTHGDRVLWYLFDRKLGGLHGEEKNLIPLPGIKPRLSNP
jgi:hypothetical protein